MFAKLRGKLNTPNKTPSLPEKQEDEKEEEDKNKQGFICPMCMTSLPGPAELQVHFEKVHSEKSDEGKLIDIDGTDEDETDALPESGGEDLASAPADFTKTRLDFSLDPNLPDTEKEVLLLQQEMADLTAALKEEKWYSGQLQMELDKVVKHRDKLEEEKSMVEEEFSSQLRSAEQGYLQVVEENNKLKAELTFADYNTTKERHEKLKQQMISYQNEAEEERQRRQALEDNFKLLQKDFDDHKLQSTKTEEQLQARPSSDEVGNLQNQIMLVNKQMEEVKTAKNNEINGLNVKWKGEVDIFKASILNMNSSIKELTTEKVAKEEQILVLQTALGNASAATDLSKQQANEKQQQTLDQQHRIAELESNIKEKDSKLTNVNKELNDTNLTLSNERNEKDNLQNELYITKTKLDELHHQCSLNTSTIKELETNILKEKDEINRLEKERVELITKIEAGEGTDTVIQQLSQEKMKLLDAVTSIEKSMAEQLQQRVNDIDVLRQEKVGVATELQKCQQELDKAERNSTEVQTKLKNAEDNIMTLYDEVKSKSDELFKLESESTVKETDLNTKIENQLASINKGDQDLKACQEKLSKALDDLKNSNHNQAQQASWIETKNKSIAEMTNKFTNLQEQISARNTELSATTKELDTTRKNLEKMTQDNEASMKLLQEQIDTLNSDKQSLTTNLATLNIDKERLEKELHEAGLQREQLEKIETELLQKQTDQSEEVKEVRGKLHLLEESRNSLQKDKEEQSAQYQVELSSFKEIYAKDLSDKDAEIKNINELLDNSKKNLEEEIKKRNETENEILKWETKYNKLESILEQKDEVLNEVQSKLEIAQQELQKPCNSCKNYEIQLCRLQESTKDQSGQITKLNENIGSLDVGIKARDDTINTMKEEHDQLNQDKDGQINELQSNLKNLIEEKETVANNLENSIKEVNQLNVNLENMASDKDGLNSLIASIKQEKVDLENKISTLDNDVIELKVDLQTKIEENEKLLKDHKQCITSLNGEKQNIEERLQLKEIDLTKEKEAHLKVKDTSQKLQDVLREESINLQNKLDKAKSGNETIQKSKIEMEKRFNNEISNLKTNMKKIENELSSKDRIITEYDMKIETSQSKTNELKGDITVLEAHLQNNNEEKKALLDRVLSTEEQLKKSKQKLSETNRKLDQALSGLQELGQENQNLQVQQTMKSNRQWEKDVEVSNCKKCEKQFTLTVRKHHCRSCGLIFCSECSAFQAVVASSKKPVRVCQTCSVELSSLRGSNVRRLSTSSIQSTQSAR